MARKATKTSPTDSPPGAGYPYRYPPTPFQHYLMGKGLSQRQLCKRIGVDPTYLSHVIRGGRQPSLKLVRTLSVKLKMSLDKLTVLLEQGE